MARRIVLTARQRRILYDLPSTESDLLRHYVLSDQDIDYIRQRRRPENKLGFALQVCALRYPGRLLQPGEEIPSSLLAFLGAQIGLSGDELLRYGQRTQTKYEHSTSLQTLYGYTKFDLTSNRDFRDWLKDTAEHAKSNEWLAHAIVVKLRSMKIILPAPTTLERLCADELVLAENRVTKRITASLDGSSKKRLLKLLEEHVSGNITRFVWLRQHEVGNNSRVMNNLLDRLELIHDMEIALNV